MCRVFRAERILERAQAGEFSIETIDKPKSVPFTDHKGQVCITNRNLYIRDHRFEPNDQRHEVARVHMHITVSGTIGASGLPEPKEMVIGDLYYRGRGNRPCALCEGGDMIPDSERFWGSTYHPVK